MQVLNKVNHVTVNGLKQLSHYSNHPRSSEGELCVFARPDALCCARRHQIRSESKCTRSGLPGLWAEQKHSRISSSTRIFYTSSTSMHKKQRIISWWGMILRFFRRHRCGWLENHRLDSEQISTRFPRSSCERNEQPAAVIVHMESAIQGAWTHTRILCALDTLDTFLTGYS